MSPVGSGLSRGDGLAGVGQGTLLDLLLLFFFFLKKKASTSTNDTDDSSHHPQMCMFLIWKVGVGWADPDHYLTL